jgi:glycosyltransferase involved in cell wall biosynthesis
MTLLSSAGATSPRRYAFVLPRYFPGLAGGAETLLFGIAQRLHARGDSVQILTTCARDNRTWENVFPEGEERIEGLPAIRFAVDPRDLDTWVPIHIAMHEGMPVGSEEQLLWMEHSVNSRAMYQYLATEGERFDLIVLGPYLLGTTFWGGLVHPHKSILVPCLHDEGAAYQDVIASMFRQFAGCIFNAEPEMHFAESLYGTVRGGVVGMGFEPPSEEEVATLEPYFTDDQPYILYLGRKETGKNVHRLIDYFCEAKDNGLIPENVKLVVLGGGSFEDLHRPKALSRADIVDLPHLSERDKQRVIRHALYLMQPSTNESFSIVLMEAWMLKTPVVVHAQCAVTRHHVMQSGGGLYCSSPEDLAGVTQYFLQSPDVRKMHGEAGYDYVVREYSWEAVMDRFDRVVGEIVG